jgi:hypothetical protein
MAGGGDKNRPDPLDPGTYPARLVQVLLLGVQPQRPYKGEEKPPKLEIMLTYEFLDEFMKDEDGDDLEDKPRWLSETLPFNNLEADLAKSTKRYYALDPNTEHGGDWSQLVETACMVTVIQNEGQGKNAGRFYENIAGVSSMRPKEAAKAPALKNPPKVFDFYEPDMTIFLSLPQWLQDKMKGAVDFGGSALEKALKAGPQDEEEQPKAKPKAKKMEVKEELEDDEIPW